MNGESGAFGAAGWSRSEMTGSDFLGHTACRILFTLLFSSTLPHLRIAIVAKKANMAHPGFEVDGRDGLV